MVPDRDIVAMEDW